MDVFCLASRTSRWPFAVLEIMDCCGVLPRQRYKNRRRKSDAMCVRLGPWRNRSHAWIRNARCSLGKHLQGTVRPWAAAGGGREPCRIPAEETGVVVVGGLGRGIVPRASQQSHRGARVTCERSPCPVPSVLGRCLGAAVGRAAAVLPASGEARARDGRSMPAAELELTAPRGGQVCSQSGTVRPAERPTLPLRLQFECLCPCFVAVSRHSGILPILRARGASSLLRPLLTPLRA